MKNQQRGFSLVELAIVLAIIGVVIAGIWAASAAVMANNREAKAQQHILQIVQNIRNLYIYQRDTSQMTMDVLLKAGVFPSDMPVTGTTVKNPWDGTVTAGYYSARERFQVLYTNIPSKSCVRLITGNALNWERDKLYLIRVSPGGDFRPPITPQQVSAACSSRARVSIMWLFYLY